MSSSVREHSGGNNQSTILLTEVIEHSGIGVVTENAANMQGAWKVFEERFPK